MWQVGCVAIGSNLAIGKSQSWIHLRGDLWSMRASQSISNSMEPPINFEIPGKFTLNLRIWVSGVGDYLRTARDIGTWVITCTVSFRHQLHSLFCISKTKV
jgi:hypothetical protein